MDDPVAAVNGEGERLRRLGRNLLAGARLGLLLRVERRDFHSEPADFAFLALFNLSAWLLGGWARAGYSGHLNAAALMSYLATLPMVLLAALAAASLCRRRESAAAIAVALVATDWVFELASQVLAALSPAGPLAGWLTIALVAWIFVTAVRAVHVGSGPGRTSFAAIGVVVAVLALVLYAFPQSDPWIQPEEEEPAPALADERLFHLQGRLIEQALRDVQPGRPGVPELYFVGFAPDGSQDVFMREMRFVSDLFERRYGTRGRSVVLASGETTLEQFPVATATNLRRVLERVGEVMNDGEDVLFLFVAAHGGADHVLSAWQPGLEAQPVNPTVLSRILHDAAIRSKVVVISACYSGGYVEPLRDEDSLIVTAAAADRTSFGCAHGNDFTYFGRAFFREALERTRSFTRAFEIAREIVGRQEADENKTPSSPLIWKGRAIDARLAPFERD